MEAKKLDFEKIRSVDTENMFDVLLNFAAQVEAAVEIGKQAPKFAGDMKSGDIFVLGMGGSAIGGDLLSDFLQSIPIETESKARMEIVRNYDLPDYVNSDSSVIASSYSGGTEETLSSFKQALKQTKNIICITTGGELTGIAEREGIPIIEIPKGYQPRCALGYSFFPTLYVLLKSGAFKGAGDYVEGGIKETIDVLQKRAVEYSKLDETNPALSLAQSLRGSIPLIYSACQRTNVVRKRWIGQFQENAKHAAFGAALPEANHNEVNSFSHPADLIKQFSIILLRDKEDHKRVKARFDAFKELIGGEVKQTFKFQSDADNLLARMFDLIYLGDWTSYYAAILNETDPTPIPLISKLKEILKGK